MTRIASIFLVLWSLTIANPAKANTRQQESASVTSERTLKLWESGAVDNIKLIPRVAIYDKQSQEVLLKDFKGNVTILVFWASWCLQCMNELLTLNQLQKDLSYNDVTNIKIVPVSIDFKPQEFQMDALENHKITDLIYYMDQNKSLFSHLQVHSLPTSFVIDRNGQIIYKFVQHLNWSDAIIYNQLALIAGNTMQPKTSGVKNESDYRPN